METDNIASKIFSDDRCPHPDDLLAYSKGRTDQSKQYMIEKHILHCLLCADALEGLAVMPDVSGFYKIKKQKSTGGKWWYLFGGITFISAIVFFSVERKTELNDIELSPVANDVVVPVPEPPPTYPKDTIASISNNAVLSDTLMSNSIISEPVLNTIQSFGFNNDSNSIVAELPPQSYSMTIRSAFPVIYIYDLKAIDYSEVYEKMEPKSVPGGLPSNYEGPGAKNDFTEFDTLTHKDVLDKGLKSFSKNDYKNSLMHFKLLLKVYPDDMNALFYSGIAEYELKNNDKAIKLLNKVLTHRNTVFAEESEWYRSLSMIANGQTEGLKKMEEISLNGGYYSEKAKKVLKEYEE